MDLKKGLAYVAFGFLFTLVNLNLTLNGTTINVIPNWIGWALLFLAFDKLGTYVSDKKYLKWLSLVLVILSGAVWLLEVLKPELDAGIVKTISTVLSAVYMFLLFESLEIVARDYSPAKEDTIRMLKIINPVLVIAFVAAGIFAAHQKTGALHGLTGILGICALAAAIVTAVTLFQLSKDVNTRIG